MTKINLTQKQLEDIHSSLFLKLECAEQWEDKENEDYAEIKRLRNLLIKIGAVQNE